MDSKQGPTLRAQWLGQQLRELRESTGHTLLEAAKYLERGQSTMSRFETAEYPIRRADVVALLDFYNVSDRQRRDEILTLRDEVWQKHWWDGYAEAVDSQFVDYPWLESRASKIRSYDPMVVTGLLQTRAYATALIENINGTRASAEQIKQWIDFRMARQEALDRDDPLRVEAILDESVLRRVVGGSHTMREQLTHLGELAQRPNIEVRALPLRATHDAGVDGTFKLFEMPEPYPEVAYMDTPGGAIYVEAPKVERFVHEYDRLWEVVLGRDESAALIAAAAAELQ